MGDHFIFEVVTFFIKNLHFYKSHDYYDGSYDG